MISKEIINQTIPDLFRQRVAVDGSSIAIQTDDEAYTYAELDAASNRIANTIIDTSGLDNEPVLLIFEQGLQSVIATLGSLKAGKIYVPVDPTMSERQLQQIVKDCCAKIVICNVRTNDIVSRVCSPKTTIVIFEDTCNASSRNVDNPRLLPASPAYIFYTSGSTGSPKGVVDSHRNILHNILRYTSSLKIVERDRLSLIQAPSFSGTVSSLFSALLTGAAILPFDVRKHGIGKLDAWVRRQRISIFHSVPSIFRYLNSARGSYPDLRIIRLEGDKVRPIDLEHFYGRFNSHCQLVNGLGATECGLVRQFFIDSNWRVPVNDVPVGYPVIDMHIKLVDEHDSEVAQGQVGEIVIESEFLALGYWKRQWITRRKFKAVPGRAGVRAYHTGDLGRLRPDGCLEYVGRGDCQRKVRGQWVDLAEIEAPLNRMPEIRDSAVTTWVDKNEEVRLVAYLVPRNSILPAIHVLRERLAGHLPAYSIPSFFMTVENLPLTRDGKLDQGSLREPRRVRLNLTTPYVGPRSNPEKIWRKIWQTSFSCDEIGVLDNFFELGGDSLTAAMIVSIAWDAGLSVEPQQIYDHPTIATLACVTDHVAPRHVNAVANTIRVPLLPGQSRFLSRGGSSPHHWNVATQVELRKSWHPALLQKALAAVIEHHDALRLRFVETGDGWRQYVYCKDTITDEYHNGLVEHFNFSELDPETAQIEYYNQLRNLQASLNISNGPVCRLGLFTFGGRKPDKAVLLTHHLVADLFSLGLILRDLETAYDQLTTRKNVTLSTRSMSFGEIAVALKKFANSSHAKCEARSWLDGANENLIPLPRDYPKSSTENDNEAAAAVSLELSREVTIQLLRNTRFHISEQLFIALSLAVLDWADTKSVLIDILRHGRTLPLAEIDSTQTVGMFAYYTPLFLDVGVETGDARLRAVVRRVSSVREHAWIFDFVRSMSDDVALRDKLHALPAAEILFNYQGILPHMKIKGALEKSVLINEFTHHPAGRRAYPIAASAIIINDALRITIVYSKHIHRRETMKRLLTLFGTHLTKLLSA